MLFAQLVDDPSSHPDKFPDQESQEIERSRLFSIIRELVIWENSTNEELLERARAEIRRSCNGELPAVHDPFSGGCTIPLEAQRLGLPACGSDLNPVAVMIGKAMIEIPFRFRDMEPVHPGTKVADTRNTLKLKAQEKPYRNSQGLAEDISYYGNWIREKVFKKIGCHYPQINLPEVHGGGKADVIAWIWARTVPSPDPVFSDVQVPLISSFLLSSRESKEVWLEPNINKSARKFEFHIRHGGTSEEIKAARKGTSIDKRQSFRCIMSGTAIPYDHIRQAGQSGYMRTKLIAIAVEGKRGRIFLSPDTEHEKNAVSVESQSSPELTLEGKCKVSVPNYGMTTFGDLFTNRQLKALNTFSEMVQEARKQIEMDALATGMDKDTTPLREGGKGAKAYAEAVSIYLTFIVNKCSNYWSSISTWNSSGVSIRSTFGRQAIPMTWDFAEANPFCSSSGSWNSMQESIVKVVDRLLPYISGEVTQQDAQTTSITNRAVISTDPPYYDNIQYADLSDYFFAWMKPLLEPVYPDIFNFLATPKSEELVASPSRHSGRKKAENFFLEGMKQAISNMARQSSDDIPATIYYAYKQSELSKEGISSTGWATFLQAVIDAGYAIVGTWPIRTERKERKNALGTNALANSVVLVCRKRNTEEAITRYEFIRELDSELPPAIAKLQAASIAPTDMPQAAIGPGMGIFSRYRAVLEADDSPMTVRKALQLINARLDEFLNDLHGDFDAETRFAITWFEEFGTGKGDYGIANNIALAKNISVDDVKHAGIVESSAGKVRILKREELEPDWHPGTDDHLTNWKSCQQLIRVLESEGEHGTARLLKKFRGEQREQIRDLAYYLYQVCADKRRDAKEAASCNGLISAWPELTRLAATLQDTPEDPQTNLDM